ncbi:MAG: response regulator transcription factor [Oligoflexia bacterium]|nr:response regulator transcription factor [Oligoflexia bacterium]
MAPSATDERTVIIADDHDILRYAVRKVLEHEGRYKILGEADNADKALELVERLKPWVLILDLGLPGKNGLEALYEIGKRELPTKVMVLSMYDDEQRIKQALMGGAVGYLLKSSSPEKILAGLAAIEKGELCLPEQYLYLAGELKNGGDGTRRSRRNPNDPLAALSTRERQIFFMLVEGSPNRDVAQKLFISPRTVETHRARIIKKLGLSSTGSLIKYAIKHNLISA